MGHRCAGTLQLFNHMLYIWYSGRADGLRAAWLTIVLNIYRLAMVYAIVVRHGDAYGQISGRIATPHVMTCRIQKLASALFIIKCSMAS